MHENSRIGLALSGGGYRAAAFHLGTLRKLHQLGLLKKVDVLSTVSGGSLAGAFFLLNYKGDFNAFEGEMRTALKKSTILRILTNPIFVVTFLALCAIPATTFYFTTWSIAFVVLLLELILLVVFQFWVFPFTKYKIKAYDSIFFKGATLKNLPRDPWISINASNLETGTLFTFSHHRMADSSYDNPKDGGTKITFVNADYPLAKAVASSTCVPFGFNPVVMEASYFKNLEDIKRAKPLLVDGGIYDNQGIHKITQRNSSFYCDISICSDGSMPFSNTFNPLNSFLVFYRATDVMMRKIKNLQFIRQVYQSKEEIAYFSLNWEYERVFDEIVKAYYKNTLKDSLRDYYGIKKDWLKDPKTIEVNAVNIKNHLKTLIGYNSFADAPLNDEEIKTICGVSTNLTSLTDTQIDLLSRHAARLAEMHIKLFIPTLAKTNIPNTTTAQRDQKGSSAHI